MGVLLQLGSLSGAVPSLAGLLFRWSSDSSECFWQRAELHPRKQDQGTHWEGLIRTLLGRSEVPETWIQLNLTLNQDGDEKHFYKLICCFFLNRWPLFKKNYSSEVQQICTNKTILVVWLNALTELVSMVIIFTYAPIYINKVSRDLFCVFFRSYCYKPDKKIEGKAISKDRTGLKILQKSTFFRVFSTIGLFLLKISTTGLLF